MKGRVSGTEEAVFHPSPAAHLTMGVTLSLRERHLTHGAAAGITFN